MTEFSRISGRRFRFPLCLAGLFLLAAVLAWILHRRLGLEPLQATVRPYVRPSSPMEICLLLVLFNGKELLLCLLLLVASGGSFLRPLGGFLLLFRGAAYGWCAALSPAIIGTALLPAALLTVYFLESGLLLLLTERLRFSSGRRAFSFLPLSGGLLLLHTLSRLILFAP